MHHSAEILLCKILYFMGGMGLLMDCNAAQTVTHIQCDCKAFAELKFCHLGRHFMKAGDYHENPLGKILYFTVGMGLIVD
jgi:hypothetical protein